MCPKAEELATDLEKMGPVFIKIGQLLSTRPDLLPVPFTEALARLQDKVAPFPFEEVEKIVSTELAMVLFLLATAGGVILLVRILFYDEPS